jgi:hypothetical protein
MARATGGALGFSDHRDCALRLIPDAIANSSVRADTTGVMVSVVPLGSLNSPDRLPIPA